MNEVGSRNTTLQIALWTSAALVCFAGNSWLCRLALGRSHIDVATFTSLRLGTGALVLLCVCCWQRVKLSGQGDWFSATALLAYAVAFSFAYTQLTTATGALILFGAVQVTMIGLGLFSGERLRWLQIGGLSFAIAGLVGLLLPGLSAPPIQPATLMIVAGMAWGIYSLRGRGIKAPLATTAGNFWRTLPLLLPLMLVQIGAVHSDWVGIGAASISGAVTSGLGYAIWYRVVPRLGATRAASLQLSVPVLTAVGGVLFLQEAISLRLIVSSIAILAGIAGVVLNSPRMAEASPKQTT